jgi:hypothetical protein
MEIDTMLGIGLLVATVVLAVATVGLWRSTSKLSGFTGESVRLTRRSLEVVESASAPRLVLYRDGRSLNDAFMEAMIEVENVGGGIAQDIVLVTSWGEGPVDTPVLHPKERKVARVRISSDEWAEKKGGEDQDPVPHRVRFLDVQGQRHDVEARVRTPSAMWVATVAPSDVGFPPGDPGANDQERSRRYG